MTNVDTFPETNKDWNLVLVVFLKGVKLFFCVFSIIFVIFSIYLFR